MPMPNVLHRIGVIVVSLLGALLIGAPLAAATGRVVIVNTGAGNINVRSGPSTSAQLLRTIPNRTRVTIVCYVRGETFRGGPYGRPNNIWNQLESGGFVTDGMLETGSNDPVVPLCRNQNAAPAPSGGRAMGATRDRNAGGPGYCTWGAYDKWFRATGGRFYPALTGDAKDWANSARATGWTVVADAQPRSMVVFQPGVYGAHATQGHVAWVDAVSGQNVTITEMNGAAGFNAWSSRTIRDIPGMSYILLP